MFLFPLPHLAAYDIAIGKARLAHVDTLVVTPDVSSLWADALVLREIRLDGVQVRQELLTKVNQWVKEETARQGSSADALTPSVRIERITFGTVDVRFRDFWLNAVDAEIEFTDGKPVEIRASQAGGRLRVLARPEGKASWKLAINARNWTVPIGLQLHFDQLETEATLTVAGISTRNLSGTLYGGSVTGPVAVSWNPVWSVTGALDIEKVDIEPVVALFKRNVAVSGTLTADPRFTLNGRDAAALVDGLELDSDFSVANGTIEKVDLIAAAKNPLDKQAGKGGKSKFDRLVGHLVIDRSGYQFSDLEVSSGLFTATGDVTLAKDQKLDGRIAVELNGTASLISMPLQVSGTSQDPSLFLTRSAMAGAVAGSFILPGIGTAAGIKVSQFTDLLFGPRRIEEEEGGGAGSARCAQERAPVTACPSDGRVQPNTLAIASAT